MKWTRMLSLFLFLLVTGGLADTLVAFAGEAEDVDAELFFHFGTDRMNVVPDEADRTEEEAAQ